MLNQAFDWKKNYRVRPTPFLKQTILQFATIENLYNVLLFDESVIDIFVKIAYFYKKWSHTLQQNKNDFYESSFHVVWKISLYFSKMHTTCMMMTSPFEICCWVKFYSHNSIFLETWRIPLVWCTFWNAIVVAF